MASSAKAITPAANGAAADVPVCENVHVLLIFVVTWRERTNIITNNKYDLGGGLMKLKRGKNAKDDVSVLKSQSNRRYIKNRFVRTTSDKSGARVVTFTLFSRKKRTRKRIPSFRIRI